MTLANPLYEQLMREALAEARLAGDRGEVPVGAVLATKAGDILARAGNQVEAGTDATLHAEMVVMRAVAAQQKRWRLTDLVLAVTLEPCTMCIGALRLARVPLILFGTSDSRLGAVGSLYNLGSDPRLGPVPEVVPGIFAEESRQLLKDFFARLR